jgi:Porin subfamily
LCSNYTTDSKTVSANYSRNQDHNVSQLGVVTRWELVRNLVFSAEVMWVHFDQKFTGTAVLSPSDPKPATRYEFRDQDTVSLQLRAGETSDRIVRRQFLRISEIRGRREASPRESKYLYLRSNIGFVLRKKE